MEEVPDDQDEDVYTGGMPLTQSSSGDVWKMAGAGGMVWNSPTSAGNLTIADIGTSALRWTPITANTTAGLTDVMISRPGKPDLAVASTLDMIMDRLCIIEPSFKLMDKYPALKEAYDAYKAIEAMCRMGDKEEDE